MSGKPVHSLAITVAEAGTTEADLLPQGRQTSLVFAPASCSCKIPMIPRVMGFSILEEVEKIAGLMSPGGLQPDQENLLSLFERSGKVALR